MLIIHVMVIILEVNDVRMLICVLIQGITIRIEFNFLGNAGWHLFVKSIPIQQEVPKNSLAMLGPDPEA